MKTLGEQWVEVIDGEEHMYKAIKGDNCKGCAFGYCNDEEFECSVFVCRVLGNNNLVVKDLGILRDGMLPCPFCGEYPEAEDINGVFIFSHKCDGGEWLRIELKDAIKQELRDTWNRRA